MKPASAKAKGRVLQKWTRDTLLKNAPALVPDDIKSTSTGATGEDVQLSPAARKIYPFKIECKNKRDVACYGWYEQAESHNGDYQPVVVIKKDGEKPLVIVDAEWFFKMWVTHDNPEKWKDFY